MLRLRGGSPKRKSTALTCHNSNEGDPNYDPSLVGSSKMRSKRAQSPRWQENSSKVTEDEHWSGTKEGWIDDIFLSLFSSKVLLLRENSMYVTVSI